MSLRAIQDEIFNLCERGEAIVQQAEKEDRELTKLEREELDRIYGNDKTPGKLAALKEEEARELRMDAERKEIAARRAVERRTFQEDAPAKPSANVHSFNGNSSARRYRRGEAIDAGLSKELKSIPNLAGEFALAAMLGPQDSTPEPIRAALSTNSNGSGGYLVPDSVSSQIIDLARNRAVLLEAGAQTFVMDAARVLVPTVETDPTIEHKAENAAFVGSDPVFGQISIEPQTLGCLVTISRELAEDGIGVASILEQLMGSKLAQMVDYYGIQGTGSAQLLGLLNVNGIGSDSVGGAVDWFDIADAITQVRVNNHEPSGVILSPLNHGNLLKSVTGDGVNAAKDWLRQSPNSEGMGYFPSNNIPDSSIIVGDFSKLMWCVRSGVRIETSVDAGEAFERHQLKMKLVVRAAWAVQDKSAFHKLTGIS